VAAQRDHGLRARAPLGGSGLPEAAHPGARERRPSVTHVAPPVRVLIVDDSVFNRRSIAGILGTSPAIEVVGRAADGEEALRLVSALKPDAITLDLEMPRMDGFTFLRILMTRTPTPVIVVSSYSQKENVFKALEL